MKYYGTITDDKDLTNKEYVDEASAEIVLAQSTEPTDSNYTNKIWIDTDTTTEVEVPAIEDIAVDFSTNTTYNTGDYVNYNGALYRYTASSSSSGAWDGTKWTQVVVCDEIESANSEVSDLKSALYSIDKKAFSAATSGMHKFAVTIPIGAKVTYKNTSSGSCSCYLYVSAEDDGTQIKTGLTAGETVTFNAPIDAIYIGGYFTAAASIELSVDGAFVRIYQNEENISDLQDDTAALDGAVNGKTYSFSDIYSGIKRFPVDIKKGMTVTYKNTSSGSCSCFIYQSLEDDGIQIKSSLLTGEYVSFTAETDIPYIGGYFTASASCQVTIPGIEDIMLERLQAPQYDLLCWGDSLTAGAGGNSVNYPEVCATILGMSFLNCGVGGETANTIAARQGGNNIIIPAGAVNGTYSTLDDIFGGTAAPLKQGDGQGSGNRLFIKGQLCSLSYSSSVYTISGYTGDALTVPTLGKFYGSGFTGGIVTIFVGQNGVNVEGSINDDALIAMIDSMIGHIGHEKYVILGFSTGTSTNRANYELKMLMHYGSKFLASRKELVAKGLTLEGITPTAQDTTDISNGTVPTSLRSDAVHLNQYGYEALGKILADKIVALGYADFPVE